MLNDAQLQKVLKRARTIAASGEYDDDCVRRLLQGLEDELKEARLEPTLAEVLQELEHLTR